MSIEGLEKLIGTIVKIKPTVIRSETGDIIRAKWLPEGSDFGKDVFFTFVWRLLKFWDGFIPNPLRPILGLLHLISFFYFCAGFSDGWMSKYYAAIGMVCVGISMYVTEEGKAMVDKYLCPQCGSDDVRKVEMIWKEQTGGYHADTKEGTSEDAPMSYPC